VTVAALAFHAGVSLAWHVGIFGDAFDVSSAIANVLVAITGNLGNHQGSSGNVLDCAGFVHAFVLTTLGWGPALRVIRAGGGEFPFPSARLAVRVLVGVEWEDASGQRCGENKIG